MERQPPHPLGQNRARPPEAMNTTEIFLVAMLVIFTVPYLVWRLARTDDSAPLVKPTLVRLACDHAPPRARRQTEA